MTRERGSRARHDVGLLPECAERIFGDVIGMLRAKLAQHLLAQAARRIGAVGEARQDGEAVDAGVAELTEQRLGETFDLKVEEVLLPFGGFSLLDI